MLKRQSEHSGLRPDTSSLVYLYAKITVPGSVHTKFAMIKNLPKLRVVRGSE